MSNEKKRLGCLGDLLGMKYYTQLCGDYFIINHEIRIPSLNNQYFNGIRIVFFFRFPQVGFAKVTVIRW